MPAIKSFLVIAALACAGALAQDRPPKVGETREPPAEKGAEPVKKTAPGDEKAAEPDKTDPAKANPTKDERTKKPPVKRRAVHQIVDGMPRPAPSVTYGPVLNPLRPSAMPPLPGVMPPSPVPISNCVGNSCLDTNGTRYNGGIGTTLLSPTGRLCNNNGATVSCF